MRSAIRTLFNQSLFRRHDHPDRRVVVEQHLPVSTAGSYRTAPVIADGHDRRDVPRTTGACSAEGAELGARPASEVIDVHAREHPPVRSTDGSAHRVHPVLVRAGVGVGVAGRPGKFHQPPLLFGQVSGRTRHSHKPTMARSFQHEFRSSVDNGRGPGVTIFSWGSPFEHLQSLSVSG
jgi:hypothetical protein